jgi:putative transposase
MMPMQGGLSVERMCELARVSRAGFYRSLQESAPGEEDVEVRSVIQQIALEHRRRYGYRRVTAELRRRGMLVNHKRVWRMMREDNLLAVQPRAFVTTTESNHSLEIYLNLARRMTLTGTDQLWVADITYIRLRSEFVYLAAILDAFSRKVVGWKLDRTLAARLAIEALEQAIVARRAAPGIVHHSDRGVQYASAEYVAILTQHGMVPSMSRPANPYDNASCESFFKTLKREEIYANEYADLDDLRDHIEEFIERYYNQKRLHSALGYCSPAEFEQKTNGVETTRSATVKFFAKNDEDSSTGLLGKGLMCRPFPQTPSLLENQRDEFQGRAGVEGCGKRFCCTCGFSQKNQRQAWTRKLSQWRGSLYQTVDDFVAAKAHDFNRIQ